MAIGVGVGQGIGGSPGSDVTKKNTKNILYIKGDADTDGSIRIVFTDGDKDSHVERRAGGVWNDTSFRFASSSVGLGRDLRIGAVGGFIESFNISEMDDHIQALIPHIQFDTSGTTKAAHVPILDVRQDLIVFAGPATGEVTGTVLGQVFSVIPSRILHRTTHTTGSIGATSQIQISYYKGTDNTGSLISRFNIAAGTMPANTTFTVIFDDDFGFENAEDIFIEFLSQGQISLATNAAGDIITTQNGHILAELDMVLDELVLANDLSFVFDNDLNFVVHNRFN